KDYAAAVRTDGVYLGPTGLIEGVDTVPARPGDAIVLFGTGFGTTDPEVPSGQAFDGKAALTNVAKIQFDTVPADVTFAGLVSPGMYHFDVVVPDLPDGDHAVTAEVGGVRTGKIVRIRTQRDITAAFTPSRATLDVARLWDRVYSILKPT